MTAALRSQKTKHRFNEYRTTSYQEALKSGIRRVVAQNDSSTIKGNIDDNLKRRF